MLFGYYIRLYIILSEKKEGIPMFVARSTNWNSSVQSSLENKFPTREVFEPKDVQCRHCSAPLKTYKTTEERTVWTLAGPRRFKEKQLRCTNDSCPTRQSITSGFSKGPRPITNPDINTIVWPHMQYGIDVVLEVGRLYIHNRWKGKRIQQKLQQKYQLDISLATIYRLIDLYEALNKAVQVEHQELIALRLQAQPIFVLLVDATQYQAGIRLYRAIDYLSGYCLGTLVISEGGKQEIKNWYQTLIHSYGAPDYIISDGEDSLHQPLADGVEVPHGDCWWHVLKNIRAELLKDWRLQTKRFLQKHRYRHNFNQIRQQLLSDATAATSPPGQALLAFLDFFVARWTKQSDFSEPMWEILLQFKEAIILLNKWDNLIKCQFPARGEVSPHLHELKALRQHFSLAIRQKWYEQPFIQHDPCFQAFQSINTLMNQITHDKQLRQLVKAYQRIDKEFSHLRTWLAETRIRQWEEMLECTTPSQIQIPTSLKTRIVANHTRTQQFLASLPKHHRIWYGRKIYPDLSLAQQAQLILDGLLTRWQKFGKTNLRYRRAVSMLKRHYPNLLVFLEHPLIPVTNQAIETDHGLLKQIWRQSSGCQDKPYTLEYHGDGLSATRNCQGTSENPSPLELLGFSKSEITNWYINCPFSVIQTVKANYERIREPRRQRLRIRRQGLTQVMAWTNQVWLDWILVRVKQYLANQGI